jgi:hypothetical protein
MPALWASHGRIMGALATMGSFMAISFAAMQQYVLYGQQRSFTSCG